MTKKMSEAIRITPAGGRKVNHIFSVALNYLVHLCIGWFGFFF